MVTKQEITEALKSIGPVTEGHISNQVGSFSTWIIKEKPGATAKVAYLAMPEQDSYDVDLSSLVEDGRKKYEESVKDAINV